MVFHLTIRAGACREIADSPVAVERVSEPFQLLQRGSTLMSLLLPWLPSRARNSKIDATRELYNMVEGYVEEREKMGGGYDAGVFGCGGWGDRYCRCA